MIVIDASLAAALVLQDETDPPDWVQERLYAGQLIAPAHWVAEIGNTLLQATRRKRLDSQGKLLAIRDLQALKVTVIETALDDAWNVSFDLAQRYGLSLYDAAYLELAAARGAALASNDSELVDAGRACGVDILTSLP